MLLTLVTFIPLIAALVVLCIPKEQKDIIKWTSLGATVVTFIIACQLVMGYRSGGTDSVVEKFDAQIQSVIDKDVGDAALKASFQKGVQAIEADNVDDSVGADRGPAHYAAIAGIDLQSLDETQSKAWHETWELSMAKGAAASEHIRFVEFGTWIDGFNIRYFMGGDGLSLPLIWLTALLSVLCLAYSWNITKATKAYFALFLILETGLMGVFLALDFFLFYVFWEIVLLPMYFLIGFWGGPRRIYASIKFFIYTLVGSVLMLICMLALYFHDGFDTFNILTLMEAAPGFSQTMQMWMFLGLFIAFAIKVPIFPFHTWLPDAHVQAPTAASVILAGVLLKMGGYGLFRFNLGLCPDAMSGAIQLPMWLGGNFIMFLAILGVINIVYGALCAMAQKDFKSMVAYSSISHMGYVLLGVAAMTDAGVQGAVLQMFNHGLSSAMMFLIVGVIYERAHHRNLNKFGGIGAQMPYYTGLATIGFFASLGLPGLNGFVSEALVFMGAWNSHTAAPAVGVFGLPTWIVFLALPGIVLTAAYILWAVQRVFMGPLKSETYKTFKDLSFREVFVLAPLGLLCIVFGVWPQLILGFMNDTLNTLVSSVIAVAGN